MRAFFCLISWACVEETDRQEEVQNTQVRQSEHWHRFPLIFIKITCRALSLVGALSNSYPGWFEDLIIRQSKTYVYRQ